MHVVVDQTLLCPDCCRVPQSTQLSNLATQAPYSSFVATYAPLAAYTDNFNAPTGLSRVALAGASYNANSLAHFAPTANATVWPPPPSTANQLRRQITDVLRATASSEHGASVRAIDAVVRGFTLIDINNELGRMADEGERRAHRLATARSSDILHCSFSACYVSCSVRLCVVSCCCVCRADLLSQG